MHFKHFAPEPKAYAVNRYDFEAWRHWQIVDDRLAEHSHMLGDDYTLVDMAVWGWARAVPFVLGAEAWGRLPHVKRLLDEINARPGGAACRGVEVEAQLQDRHGRCREEGDVPVEQPARGLTLKL